MSDDTQQEMTLQEWLARLPPSHRANREFSAIEAKLRAARDEVESQTASAQSWRKEADGFETQLLAARDEVARLRAAIKEMHDAEDALRPYYRWAVLLTPKEERLRDARLVLREAGGAI